jgi:cell division septation protein DedD
MSTPLQPSRFPELERRLNPRKELHSSSVQLADGNRGIVLNLSESGCAMKVVGRLQDDSLPPMRFQLSQSDPWIETKGRVTWVDSAKTTAGVEFIDLSFEKRIRIKKWISPSAQLSLSAKKNTLAGLLSDPAHSSSTLHSELGKNVREIEHRIAEFGSDRSRQFIGALAVSAALFLLVSIFVVFHLRNAATASRSTNTNQSDRAPATGVPAAANQTASSSANESKNASNAAPTAKSTEGGAHNTSVASSQVSSPLPERVDFALQVGAMGHKENADALATSLRQLNFPVYVLEPESGGLYRVMVGPYPDVQLSTKAQNDLKAHNFDSIRKRVVSSGKH